MVKVYATHRQNLNIAWQKPTETEGHTQNVALAFKAGRFSTDDEATQKYIESLPTFKDTTIYLYTPEEQLSEAKAKAAPLRAAADKAEAEAKAAEAVVKSLTPTAKAA